VPKKYGYVRYAWWEDVDVEAVARELGERFTVRRLDTPGVTPYEISIYQNTRQEVLVKADTLKAYVSRFRATMFQREPAPFTGRDLELRARLMELYPRNRPSPAPWLISHETPFDVAEKEGNL
jgi:hypothetical protein